MFLFRSKFFPKEVLTPMPQPHFQKVVLTFSFAVVPLPKLVYNIYEIVYIVYVVRVDRLVGCCVNAALPGVRGDGAGGGHDLGDAAAAAQGDRAVHRLQLLRPGRR